jgi:alpha/beta superfamily hydrolase
MPEGPHADATTPTEERASFQSDALKLSGVVHLPGSLRQGERRAAFLVLHGFGGSKQGKGSMTIARQLAEWGYVAMRFDFRGCGESEGEHGRVICQEQVRDTSNAVSYMAGRRDVEPGRVGLIGSSFGAAVAVYTGGVDARVAAVISQGGWGNGERKFRAQHPTPEAWERFTKMLAEGKAYRERTGKSLMVPRYEIVPIPPGLRENLSSDSIMEFPAETPLSMCEFKADDVVGRIAPRPLLLLHSATDSVTPMGESIEMFRRAGQPTELHLLTEVNHFMFSQGNARVSHLVSDWLSRYFPSGATTP